MNELIIGGGRRLEGAVNIHGAKNSILPILSATVLLNGKSVLHNCPDLSDVTAALNILENLGIKCIKHGSDIEVFSKEPTSFAVPNELMCQMRSSVMFLGSILGRCKNAVISTPGGCELGPRPIDIHISAVAKFSVKVIEDNSTIRFSAENGLKGNNITLAFPSVGATENIIMAAVLAEGTTTLINAAREPEIVDLANFLNKAGARISGAGTSVVFINGVRQLGCAEHSIIPDRIEAVTYMSAVAITGGSVTLNSVFPSHFASVTSVFRKTGCAVTEYKDKLVLTAPDRLKSVRNLKTQVYPGFPTDAGPLIVSMLSVANGTSVFTENIFKNRFNFAAELRKFGAKIITKGQTALIEGTDYLLPSDCECTDLRGGAAIIVAALKAKGKSRIGKLCHIKRGYQDIVVNLKSMGADIVET